MCTFTKYTTTKWKKGEQIENPFTVQQTAGVCANITNLWTLILFLSVTKRTVKNSNSNSSQFVDQKIFLVGNDLGQVLSFNSSPKIILKVNNGELSYSRTYFFEHFVASCRCLMNSQWGLNITLILKSYLIGREWNLEVVENQNYRHLNSLNTHCYRTSSEAVILIYCVIVISDLRSTVTKSMHPSEIWCTRHMTQHTIKKSTHRNTLFFHSNATTFCCSLHIFTFERRKTFIFFSLLLLHVECVPRQKCMPSIDCTEWHMHNVRKREKRMTIKRFWLEPKINY